MLTLFTDMRGRWAALLLLGLLAGSARGATFEFGSTNTVLNQGSTNTWVVDPSTTPGQFKGAISLRATTYTSSTSQYDSFVARLAPE